MTPNPRNQPHDPGPPITRGISYELLARAFAHPSEAAVEAMAEIAALALAVETATPIRALARAIEALDRQDAEREYVATFTMATSADCPTFESAYVCTDGGQQTTVMADVAGFYRAFGLELGEHTRPDEITVELEFLGFLCRKEAYAAEHLGAPRVRQARRAQRMFLSEHAGRWAETFGRDVFGKAPAGGFYSELGAALADWVGRERAALCPSAVTPVERPSMPWPGVSRSSGEATASEGHRR